MPPRHTVRRGEDDGDRVYVTSISLTENVKLRQTPNRGYVSANSSPSSDYSDSGYYQEIPVEVYLKPKTSKKPHSQKSRNVVQKASKPESPDPETRLYVYIPEEVSLDRSLSDDEAIVHQVRSGYRQDKTTKPHHIKLVQRKPSPQAQHGYKMVPATYTEKRPKAMLPINELRGHEPQKDRRNGQYREVPSYQAFSDQRSSHRPTYPQQSSPIQFRKSKPPPQANIVKKPQPIRVAPQDRRPKAPLPAPPPPPPQQNVAFRQITVQKRFSKSQQTQFSDTKTKQRVPKPPNNSGMKAFRTVPTNRPNVKKVKQVPVYSESGRGLRAGPVEYPCSLYIDQDYDIILQECLAKGKLFVDREFPADNESLGYEIASYRRITWMRPYLKRAESSNGEYAIVLRNWPLTVFLRK